MNRLANQQSDPERLPKNFPALQERMDAVKRSSSTKPAGARSPLEKPLDSDKDDSFFLL